MPPPSRRAWSLLAWLALHPGEHPRTAVAARFWPDVLDTSARASLRSAVWGLRRALGTDEALIAGRNRIGLRCETDLARFDAYCAAGELEAAVALNRGPLLADLDEGYPDFPMPQALRSDGDGHRVTVSCLTSHLVFEWRLEPTPEDGTRIAVHVEIPEAEAHRLNSQRDAVSASLRSLAALAATGAPRAPG